MHASDRGRRVFVQTIMYALLVACIMLLVVAAWPLAASADDAATVDVSWYEDNHDSDEFEVQTAAELRGLAQLVNDGTEDFSGKTVYLMRSIDLSSSGDPTEFTPIGTEAHPFAGTFEGAPEGDRHTISNLCITAQLVNAGLFGYTSSTSAISNVVLRNGEHGGVSLVTDTAYIGSIGSLAGKADGAVRGCESDVTVTVESGCPASTAVPYVVQNIGGLVGYARGDMDDCAYAGQLSVEIASDALDPDTSSDSLRVADSFGGVVGRFGDPSQHGTLSDCHNLADVVVQTVGDAGIDRFGTETHAVAFFVGGVAGYSNGSVLRCYNGAYNELTREVTGRVFTGVYGEDGTTLAYNRGGDQVGGIVGSLRGESDDPGKYNDGDPNDPMLLADCYNEAQVTGLVAVGGICGQTGVYCTITRCRNGTMTDLDDWQRNQVAGKVVSTRWNKPFSAGIVGQCRSGVVSYCANYAEVRNIQTGYYMAGIAGCIFVSDDYPSVTGAIYSCLNTGGIYTVNTSKGAEYREAGICGENEGYVHDCILLEGSVPFHSDSAIGANTWGATANLEVWSSADLQGSSAAAFLNAMAAQDQDWSCYWFINGTGYPVLNTWAALDDEDRVLLTSDRIASWEQLAPAPYTGEGTAAIPTLSIVLDDGTTLVQNADFRVIPEEGAYAMSDEGAYSAGIEGLGRYRGIVENCARYAIGAADLAQASVFIPSMKYAFGKVVFPTSVEARINGNVVPESEYDCLIYNSVTSASDVSKGKGFAVYDSAGYLSYSKSGGTLVPLSGIDAADLNDSEAAWWLFDRKRELISDSAGNSYYTTSSGGGTAGALYGADTSCVNLKSGSPAGYVVELRAKSTSEVLAGSAIGYYVIDPVSIYTECDFELATVGDQTWYWDASDQVFYEKDALGNRKDGVVSVTFTGQTIEPAPVLRYGSYQLRSGVDYRVVCGDPDPSEVGVVVDANNANRNVTAPSNRNAITILPVDSSNLSNYVIAYFDIVPARLEDCEVSLSSGEWAYTGEEITPDVIVKLNGVQLVEGLDYEVEYADNTKKGRATYRVIPLANLSGGSMDPVEGTFEITDGASIADYSVGEIPDQQFNYGYDVHPALSFEDEAGQAVELVEGVDYTVSYSTRDVTKWPASDEETTPCVATIVGKGRYTGSLEASFAIVPYDASRNATGQLRVTTQDRVYGTWGTPPSSKTLGDGSVLTYESPANFGPAYPVVTVEAYPIVDWAAYEAGDLASCYGPSITLTRTNNNAYGSLASMYPVAYYRVADDVEVNGSGACYKNNDDEVIATPQAALPGEHYAVVSFRTGTGGAKDGATGQLVTDVFSYMGPADISTVNWGVSSTSACLYTGSSVEPIVGTMQGSGIVLERDADYTIQYENNIQVGTAKYRVTAIAGDDALFTGSYSGEFSVLPYDLETGADVVVSEIDDQEMDEAGSAVQPHPEVYVGGRLLAEGDDYSLSYRNNTAAGDATVRIIGTGNYTGVKEVGFTIVSGDSDEPVTPSSDDTPKEAQTISASNLSVVFGKTANLGAKLTKGDGALSYRSSNTAVATVNTKGVVSGKKAGSATITVTAAATGKYKAATKTVKVTVTKAANTFTAKGKTVSLKAKTLKKKTQTIKKAKVYTLKKAQGKLAYKLASVSKAKFKKYFKVNAKNGTITVKKGLAKGAYKVKVKVTAAGNANYDAAAKTATVTVKVK